jgi:hypothetical protein
MCDEVRSCCKEHIDYYEKIIKELEDQIERMENVFKKLEVISREHFVPTHQYEETISNFKELSARTLRYKAALECAYKVLDNPVISMGDKRKLIMGDITEALDARVIADPEKIYISGEDPALTKAKKMAEHIRMWIGAPKFNLEEYLYEKIK